MRFIACWLWLLIPMTILGHSPSQSSTVLVQDIKGGWTLQIRAALSGFEYVVNNTYGDEAFATPKEFEELVFELISKRLRLTADGIAVDIKNPKMKLGHEGMVVYQVTMPDDFETVEIKNNFFQSIHKSKSSFVVLKNGVNRELFSLEKNNDYTVNLKLEENAFALQNTGAYTASISDNIIVLIATGLTILAISLFIGLKPIKNRFTKNKVEAL